MIYILLLVVRTHDHNTHENKIQRERASQNRKELLFYTSNSAFKISNRRQETFFFFCSNIDFRGQSRS